MGVGRYCVRAWRPAPRVENNGLATTALPRSPEAYSRARARGRSATPHHVEGAATHATPATTPEKPLPLERPGRKPGRSLGHCRGGAGTCRGCAGAACRGSAGTSRRGTVEQSTHVRDDRARRLHLRPGPRRAPTSSTPASSTPPRSAATAMLVARRQADARGPDRRRPAEHGEEADAGQVPQLTSMSAMAGEVVVALVLEARGRGAATRRPDRAPRTPQRRRARHGVAGAATFDLEGAGQCRHAALAKLMVEGRASRSSREA